MVLRVVTGSRHLDGFIGYPDAKKSWIMEKVKGWTDSVEVMARVVL